MNKSLLSTLTIGEAVAKRKNYPMLHQAWIYLAERLSLDFKLATSRLLIPV
ncbi:hypothetical protein H6G17_30110 [Chroococcidiopsis sp. FACHB-1243]|uniref:hypothetical protein n=1 Tax=Chroococcidiopsis sp. [FACHB-1243] TaxID=2692781 RepID=UPI00177F39E1|nr:hypothetical protein [Chroococcidiopsis sp. [FACHB-1243]]MBD2309680.1 hypothetical protein [Chroococcidiopsis sp. [FACHB-1243]]